MKYKSQLTVGFARAHQDVTAKRKYEEEVANDEMHAEFEENQRKIRRHAAYVPFPKVHWLELRVYVHVCQY